MTICNGCDEEFTVCRTTLYGPYCPNCWSLEYANIPQESQNAVNPPLSGRKRADDEQHSEPDRTAYARKMES